MSASDLDVLLKWDTDGTITTHLYDKQDHFPFSIVNFLYLRSNIIASPAYGVDISQITRYARACSTYDQFLV
jgi:Fe-S-cluster formation regulator IscX/YfhJ